MPRPHFRYLSPPPGAGQPGAGAGYCVPDLRGPLPPGAATAGRPGAGWPAAAWGAGLGGGHDATGLSPADHACGRKERAALPRGSPRPGWGGAEGAGRGLVLLMAWLSLSRLFSLCFAVLYVTAAFR